MYFYELTYVSSTMYITNFIVFCNLILIRLADIVINSNETFTFMKYDPLYFGVIFSDMIYTDLCW